MRSLIDRHYRYIRPFRFLYGWAKDARARAQCRERAASFQSRGFRDAKLDICGGRNPYHPEEFLNCDIVAFPQVDIVLDLRKSLPFSNNVIAEIFSAATLEHLRKPHVDHVLREFFRILKSGGILRVCTPDLEAIAHRILRRGDLAIINQHLFGKYKGDETEDLDLHKWMYTADALIEELERIGFVNVVRIPNDTGLHDPELNFLIRARKP